MVKLHEKEVSLNWYRAQLCIKYLVNKKLYMPLWQHFVLHWKCSNGPLLRLGESTPAKAEQVSRFDEEAWEDDNIDNSNPKNTRKEVVDVILYFGIIDILQDYDITKKLEHAYKSLHADPTSISAVDPKLYSKRFRDFINRIFIEDKWEKKYATAAQV